MKDSKDVLTPIINQMSNSASEQLKRAKQYSQELTEGKNTQYVWADMDFNLRLGLDEGYCYGWVHYLDGRKLFFFGETKSFIGDRARMSTTQSISTPVLPFDQLVSKTADFHANGDGIGFGGELTMTFLDVPISPFPWRLEGQATISWIANGSGRFIKA